jgi:hypothetical protein
VTDTPPVRRAFRTAIAPLLLSLGLTVVCHLALGATTGLFFATVFLVTLLAPPLSMTRADFVGQAFVMAGVVDGVALGLAFATADPLVSFADWLRAYVLLVCLGLTCWGATAALVRLRLPPVPASATVVVLALLWLAWPIWLSPWLAGRGTLVDWLTWPHPLLALDGALRHLGPPWTERHFMYTRLTVLNQDVFYTLPGSIWPSALLHALLGAGLLFLVHGRSSRAAPLVHKNDTEHTETQRAQRAEQES